MDIQTEESKNVDDVPSKLTYLVKQFFDQFSVDVDQTKHQNENITTHLHDLNEDCLLEIFSTKTLDLMDLCSIAETCTRFEHIAGRVIPNAFSLIKNKTGNYTVELGSYRKSWNSAEILHRGLRDIKRIFRNFGSKLSKVSISNSKNVRNGHITEGFLLHLVGKYCVGNLKGLSIVNCRKRKVMKIPRATAVELKPIFKQLQVLYLDYIFIDDDKTLFDDCSSLLQLKVYVVEGCDGILDNVFPKLELFQYGRHGIVMKTLPSFILRHRTLNVLKLWIDCDDGGTCNITIPQAIVNSCKNLENLRISSKISSSYLEPLQELKSLRSLSIRRAKFDDLKLLSAFTNLRTLHIHRSNIPSDSNQFPSLTQLTKLKVSGYSCRNVIDIVSRLIHLEWLEIYWDPSYQSFFVLDEETFTKIVAIVKGRSHTLELVCKFYFHAKNCDENQIKTRFLVTK